MEDVLELLVSSLASGCIYALLALSYLIVRYRVVGKDWVNGRPTILGVTVGFG